jgi:hypothetical protein
MGRRADEVVVAHAVVVEAAAAAVRARVEEESEVLASVAKVVKAAAQETMRLEAVPVCRAALHAAVAVALAALCRMRAVGTLPQCKAAARRISSNSSSKAASNNSSTNSSSSIRMRDLRWVEGAEGAAEV